MNGPIPVKLEGDHAQYFVMAMQLKKEIRERIKALVRKNAQGPDDMIPLMHPLTEYMHRLDDIGQLDWAGLSDDQRRLFALQALDNIVQASITQVLEEPLQKATEHERN